MDHKEAAKVVLQKICAELDRFTTNDTNTGLLGGYTGAALFYAYYYQLTQKEEHLDKIGEIIGKCLEALSTQPMNGSHCSGVAGIAWCIQHLSALGFIFAEDTEDTFAEIDGMVSEFMEAELREGHNDFLHQGLGPALYFLERLPSEVAERQLQSLVQHLERTACKLPAGIAWKDEFSSSSERHKDQDLFNLGLAHGVPAIISVLARCYEKGIARDTVRPLVKGSVQWLMGTRNKSDQQGHSLYPTQVNARNEVMGEAHSRLGWCYGDLGIASTLWGTGRRLQRSDYQDEARRIFLQIAGERNLKNGAVNDACLCHGSAGIAHILHQARILTGEADLFPASQFWLETTLQMNTWEDGPAGFKFYHHPDYVNSHNMLEGIAGIGLSLIGFLDEEIKPAWEESMLIF